MYQSGRRSAGGSRLPSTSFRNLKTVEVGRGRNGYGFTIAGQHPCILSCIMPSSPAEAAMLKAGDCVIAINGENVTAVDHEEFIKRIGETTGVLRLTVADMVVGDDEIKGGVYNPTGAVVRAGMPGIQRTQMVLDELNNGALFRANSPMRAEFTHQMYYGETVPSHSHTSVQDKFAPGHLSPFNHSSHQVALKGIHQQQPPTHQPVNGGFWNGQEDNGYIDPVSKYKNRQRLRALSKRSYYVQEDPYVDGDEGRVCQDVDDENRPLTPYELNNIAYPSMAETEQLNRSTPDHMEDGDSTLMKSIVGYLGSVDIPATANLPTASLQAIRGCVRRLRVEQRVHSLMMMNIAASGIKLVNASGQVAVTYPADKIVFSGICPDDRRCFGVVTAQNLSPRPEGDEEQIGSACHVFIIDPELCSHSMHEEISLRFGLNCMPDPESHTCVEYPASSQVVLHKVSRYYRDRRESSSFGDFYGQSPYIGFVRRSNSISSNSDSGFGNSGREPNQPMVTNDSDKIVDVASHIRSKRANRTVSSQQQSLLTTLPNQDSDYQDCLASHNSQTRVEYGLSGLSEDPGSNDFIRNRRAPMVDPCMDDRLAPRVRPHSMIAPPRPSEEPPVRSASVSVFEMMSSESHHEKDVRRQPLMPLALGSGWENGADLPQRSLPREITMYDDDYGHRQRTTRTQYLHPARGSQTMANLRRGSDCSDYNTAHQNARRNALQRIQQKQNSIQDQLQRNSLTASDSELNTIDEPASPRQDENRGSQADLVDDGPQEVGRVSGWAVSFERLLKDELGLAYFTDFLKQEFSEENILFWISCEQLSKVTDGTKLKEKAETIYRRFLSSYATMPVNLEGNYRQMVESAMKNPTPEMYKDQQSQIFKLMKLDSYSRFLKSKLYQDCVLSEMGNLPLPAIESQSITDLGDLSERGPSGARTPTPTPSDSDTLEKKPKKKADKTGKNKVQGRDGDVPESLDRQTSDEKKQRSLLPWFKGFTGKRVGTTRSNNEKETQFYVTSPTPHIPISHSETELSRPGYSDSVPRHQRSLSQFSATFPNNVILTIKVIPDKTIGEVLLPLCEEHGLTQQTAEIFLKTSKGGLIVREKLIDLTQDVSALGGREIVVERRVVFKIELPCKRLIGVKSKPTKKLIEVLRPVTYKYDLQLDRLVVHLNNSPIPLDLEITVAALDNQRIMVETFEQYSANSDSLVKAADIRSKGNLQNERPRRSSSPARKTSDQSSNGKSANDKQQPASTNGPSTMQQNNNNHSGNMRLTEVDDATDLYRLVAKANRRRLDDQRGLTLRNLEVPDFLLNRGDPPTRPQTSLGVAERGGVQRAQEVDLRPTSTPPRQAPPPGCDFETGTIPTHKQAAELFGGADGNISFSGSLNSSGYPDSMPDTGHTGEGMTPEQYRIPDEGYTPTNDRSNYHPKVSGISIMSEVDIPMSPLYESQNGADHSPGFDADSTLTAPGRENYSDVQATPTPSHDATALGGVPDIAAHNGGERLSTLPRRNNNYMKTLYEESSSQDRNSSSNNSAKPRVARKPPMVAPKPQARRTTSIPVGVKLPTAKKVITVIGADGKQHRATFV